MPFPAWKKAGSSISGRMGRRQWGVPAPTLTQTEAYDLVAVMEAGSTAGDACGLVETPIAGVIVWATVIG
jgi:hypothetical protein